MSGPAGDSRSNEVLRRTMAAMEKLRDRLEARIAAEREPIAVVGLGCRFPGIDGPDAFAAFLEGGGDVMGRVSQARIRDKAGPCGERYRTGGFFDDVAEFDAAAFGIGEDEARAMDPHLRLLLEVSRDAIEDAALAGGQLNGSRTSVHLALGAQNGDFASALMADPAALDRHAIAGSFHSLMPGRLSYHFDLRGPSYVVDAACASSLVALDLACQALRRGDCDTAIVAAVNLVLSDAVSAAIDRGGLWSAGGRSRSFDEAADGFVRGEGAGALVLRRQSDAISEGDPIRSLVLGCASGQDGHGNGVAAPNGPAQSAVMRRALEQADIPPDRIGYVEAHATGTRLGDAIEAEALAQVYGAAEGRETPLVLGALKPALGHLEAASGMAAIIRVILAQSAGLLPNGSLPETLNREIAALGDGTEGIVVAAGQKAWPEAAPYAAVSAFGMSGTNAHAVLSAPPAAVAGRPSDGPFGLSLAAPDEGLLRLTAGRLAACLDERTDLAAFCHTLRTGRVGGMARFSAPVSSVREARALLQSVAEGEPFPDGAVPEETGTNGTTHRLNLPPTPFRRKRFWPEFAQKDDAGLQPAPATKDSSDPEGLFFSQEWEPVSAAATQSVDPLIVTGDRDLAGQLLPIFQAAGIEIVQSSLADLPSDGDCRVLYLAGPSFADVVTLHQSLPALVGRSGRTRFFLTAVGGEAGRPLATAMLVLGRTIAVEHPELHLRLIDLDPDIPVPGADLPRALDETLDEPMLRVSAGGLLAPRLGRTTYPQAVFRPDPAASHLITGGFGGIGRAVARRLVERGARHLVLVGRRPQPLEEHVEYEAQGVRIHSVAADVADRAAMSELFDNLEREGRPVKTVFHTAGTVANDLLVHQPLDDFSEPFRSKLLGASVLDNLTRERPLDAFVLFSSITCFVPLAGAGAYAAANASLGGIARARRNAGLHALCAYWGTWEGSGMVDSAGAALAGGWSEHGIEAIPQGQALDAMEALLAADAAQQIVARCDWRRIASHAMREGSGAALYSNLLDRKSDVKPVARTAIPSVEQPDAPADDAPLDEIIRDAVARAVGLDPLDPRLGSPFGDLGLSSLAAVELRNDLSGRLGIRLPATLAFNYPSVHAMTDAIGRRIAST